MKVSYRALRGDTSVSQRSVTMGTRAMVASSQHLATLAGYRTLAKGGNAVDAAVTMVSVLNVVEPHSVGIGGDAFALIYLSDKKRLLGLNASGRAPRRARPSFFLDRGFHSMPQHGILAVTVPGALAGWVEAVTRFGQLPLAEVFADAIDYAQNGFAVTEVIAGEWQNAQPVLAENAPGSAYLCHGNAPRAGTRFRNPDLAHTFKMICEQGADALYRGEIGRRIIACSHRHGGLLEASDLAEHTSQWVEPLYHAYRGYTVAQLPPNGQGVTVLEMLNILQGFDLAAMGHNSVEYLHHLIEAKKIAFADRDRYIADPQFTSVPIKTMLSAHYGKRCRQAIDSKHAMAAAPDLMGTGSETVYVTAVDADRNAVSLISSLFTPFGSGVVVEDTGIVLQNRGNSFSLDPAHPNVLAPGKRPMHTIIPGMVFTDNTFQMSFGVMGGDMQPQGHVQFLANLLDFGMNLQQAMDAPRCRHRCGPSVYLEPGIGPQTAAGLRDLGHMIVAAQEPINQVGGGQAIWYDRENDVLLGASDRRKDGCALGY
jgi:gamma-glutamyltranspeptidase/glutathione hydrolase